MSEHTKGPWELGRNGDIEAGDVFSADRVSICNVYDATLKCQQIEARNEAFANARLIAAAPDLLEALQQTKNVIRNILTDSQLDTRLPCGVTIRKYSKSIDAAIAKATGK